MSTKISPGSTKYFLIPLYHQNYSLPKVTLQYHVLQCVNVLPTRIHNYDTQNYVLLQPTIRCRVEILSGHI